MKRFFVICSVLILTVAMAGLTFAGEVPTPTDPPTGVTLISAADAKGLMDKGGVQVYDMRKALNFGKGHLPGAVSSPYKWLKKGHPAERTGEYDMSKLPEDKNALVLFHSDGPNGWKSYYASKAAAEAGYSNVYWMRDGFATWQEKGYTIEH